MSYDIRDRHKHNGDRLTAFPPKKTPASGRMLDAAAERVSRGTKRAWSAAT